MRKRDKDKMKMIILIDTLQAVVSQYIKEIPKRSHTTHLLTPQKDKSLGQSPKGNCKD